MNFPTNPNAELLFHFNDNVEDSSGNNDDGSATAITYVASGAGATSSGFGKAAVFDGSSQTAGGDSYITLDDPGIGTGDFTVEAWVKFDVLGTDNAIVTNMADQSSHGAGYFGLIKQSSSDRIIMYYSDGSLRSDVYTIGSGVITSGTWHHLAVVRSGTTHTLYIGDAGTPTGARVDTWTHTAYSIGASAGPWVLGRLRGSSYGNYNMTGQLDEFYITKEAKYSGATYDIPTAPYLGPGDLFTINNITYKFNNPGWEIHKTTADTITTDCGVVSFAGQSAAPAAIPHQAGIAATTEGVLSLHFDNNLTDSGSSGATITHPGSNNLAPTFSTSSQYGSHSIHLDTTGGGDFLLVPYSSDLKWDGDFTVDFWIKFDAATFSLSGANYIIIVSADERTSPSPSDLGFNLGFHGSAHPTVARSFFMSVGNSANTLRASCLINYYGLAANVSDADMQNKFNHLAICRESNVIRAWLNGIEMTQSSVTNSDSGSILTTSGTVNSYNMGMCIGRDMQFAKVADTIQSNVHDFSGYIDELRMVKGSAEFTGATFTPPVRAHGSSVVAISGKAQLYGKSVTVVGGGGGDALYNFSSSDPTDDEFRAGDNGVVGGTPSTSPQYVTNHASIGAAFGDQLRLTNSSYIGPITNNQLGNPGNILTIPNHGIGAGSYTIEFFYDPVDATTNTGVFCLGYATWGTIASVALWSSNMIQVRIVHATSIHYVYFDHNWSADVGTMKHWAFCREINAPSAGQSRVTLFIDGVELPVSSYGSYTNTVSSISNYNLWYNEDLYLGLWRGNSSTAYIPKSAVYDSVLVNTTCKYPAGSPPSPVPSDPFLALPLTTTELYMMDGSGTETKLT